MKDYKKYFIVPATPEEVYIALTNPLTLSLWTGESAEMSIVPQTEFSLFEGSIVGMNLSFEENKKIEQEWYFGDEAEAPSIVSLKLHTHKEGTSVELRHINIPEEAYDDMVAGWNETYFAALIDFFEDDGMVE
jgi:activator of HSP90 ATPase